MAYILIVDKDEGFANAAAAVLKNAGHKILVESDVDAALACIKKKNPDLVILDVMFPEKPSAGSANCAGSKRCRESYKTARAGGSEPPLPGCLAILRGPVWNGSGVKPFAVTGASDHDRKIRSNQPA